MEHGSYQNPSASTFSITEEDHTLANSLRLVLNKDPRVSFCGYSIPHPSEPLVNIRVQTTGDPAGEVLKDGCQNLISICEHVRKNFDDAVEKFKSSEVSDAMDDSP
ncbi:DNA-directed RNA polymerases I and III subunit RPAC2 [Bienertia sinuspersici]